jgi:tetratricopeptide (TPR) repeat protein
VLHNYVIFKIFYFEKNEKLANELLSELNEITTKNPKNFAAIDTQGFILLNIKNDIESAKERFFHALELNPKYVHSINSLGLCFLREGKTDEAIERFNNVLTIDNTYPPAYENLAFTYTILKDKKSKLRILQAAIDHKVKVSKDWEHEIGWLMLQLGDLDNAINWYKRKINEEPNNNLLYNNLGICSLQKDETKNARKFFEKAIAIYKSGKGVNDQRSTLAFYNLARVCIDLEDYSALENVIKDIYRINPQDTYVKYLRGTVALRRKDYVSGKKYFEDVLNENPNIPEVYPDYAFILECIDRDYKKAIDIIHSGLKRGYINLFSLNNLAYAYIRSGNLLEGERVLKSIKQPLNNELLATKGLLEFRKGSLENGDKYYEQAIHKLKGKDEMQRQAEQIWKYEKSLYYFKNNEFRKSTKYLDEAKMLGDTYLNTDIKELYENLNSKDNA